MAISSIGSYPPTMEEFIAHWTEVNAALAPGALLLQGGFTLANFTTARTDIVTAIDAVTTADNSRQGDATDRDIAKAALKSRLAQFRAGVASQLPGSRYAGQLPVQPPFRAIETTFLRPLVDMAGIWNEINTDTIPGFTGPLLLSGAYTLAMFNTDLTALRAAYLATTVSENGARSARGARDVLLAPAKNRMKQYRSGVKAALPPGHALQLTIPALTPPPGSTPDPVNLTAVWNETTLEADLTVTPSTNPNLDHYDIRSAPGPHYRAADEFHVATIPAGETTVSTNVGLGAPGATALYRAYVVLSTLNERGSNTVSVTRPG